MSGNHLIISDLQIPFEAEHALKFCAYLKRHYKITDENVYNVGDEIDAMHGGMYPKDPNGHHTPNSEIQAARDKIQEWGAVFPKMRLAISNHGVRWLKKATAAEIPSQLLRSYEEMFHMPEGWHWRESWLVNARKPFQIKHGVDLGGKTPYRIQAELGGLSCAFGHLHSSPGICHVRTMDKNIWAMNTGCLIDVEAYAFKYDKDHKFKPGLGCGVVLNDGRMPIWVPYE